MYLSSWRWAGIRGKEQFPKTHLLNIHGRLDPGYNLTSNRPKRGHVEVSRDKSNALLYNELLPIVFRTKCSAMLSGCVSRLVSSLNTSDVRQHFDPSLGRSLKVAEHNMKPLFLVNKKSCTSLRTSE